MNAPRTGEGDRTRAERRRGKRVEWLRARGISRMPSPRRTTVGCVSPTRAIVHAMAARSACAPMAAAICSAMTARSGTVRPRLRSGTSILRQTREGMVPWACGRQSTGSCSGDDPAIGWVTAGQRRSNGSDRVLATINGPACRGRPKAGRLSYAPRSRSSWREITMRWISLVPSPISQTLASRIIRSTG